MKIFNFKKFEKNTVRAFFSIELDSGLILHGCSLHSKNGGEWVGYAQKEYTRHDGTKVREPLITFKDKQTCDKLRDKIIQQLTIDRFID